MGKLLIEYKRGGFYYTSFILTINEKNMYPVFFSDPFIYALVFAQDPKMHYSRGVAPSVLRNVIIRIEIRIRGFEKSQSGYKILRYVS